MSNAESGSQASRRRTALITGASAGIGAEFARQLAARGYDLILTARRVDRLEQLSREIARTHGGECWVLPCDLSDLAAVERLCQTIAQSRRTVDYLVNNAGYSLSKPFLELDWRQHVELLNVLLTSVVRLSHAFIPGMKERQFGRVINVASLAAFLPGTPTSPLYTPTKAFLVKMSQALAGELSGTNVNVCALCPGFTYSEFHDVNGTRQAMNRLPRFMWMPAQPVVRAGLVAIERGKVVCVPGVVNQLLKVVMALVPDLIVGAAWTRRVRRLRPQSGAPASTPPT